MTESGIGNINLKVLLMDSDYYVRQAVSSYLAWDRRTRVTFKADSLESMWEHIRQAPVAELPDVVVMDSDHFDSIDILRQTIIRLRERIDNLVVVCIAQFMNSVLVETAAEAGAGAYLLKQEVQLQIAQAICYALEHDFVVTPMVAQVCANSANLRITRAAILPEQQDFPELTDRIRQAVMLCVVEGMPAHLAADEMGISLNTVRGYIKEGYRILEAYDESEYPVDMTAQERAFMRLTALAHQEDDEEDTPPENATPSEEE